MTASPGLPAQEALDVETAAALVRASGLRLSAARRLVLEALFAAKGPVSAEQIAEGLDGQLPRSDLASTYRNLETLERLGLIRHVHLGHGPGLYALAREADHEYVVCDRCGAFETCAPERLDGVRDAVRWATGYKARFTHFPLVGLCPACAAKDTPEPPPEEHHAHP